MGWLDLARGGGIVLVVFGHVWRGLVPPGVLSDQTLFGAVDQFIYLFHMPVFFLLSGYVFLSGRWEGLVAFTRKKLFRLLWPALLWVYLFVGVNVAAGAWVNTQFNAETLLGWPPFGATHLWFLWALFLIQMVAMGLKAAPGHLRPILLLVLAFAALWVRYGQVVALPVGALPALSYMPIFLAGAAIWMLWQGQLHKARLPFGLGVAGGVAFVAAQIIASVTGAQELLRTGLGLVAAAGFVALSIWWWAKAQNSPLVLQLCRLGQASMAIYLTHVFFTAGLRIALIKLGITGLAPHLVLGTVLGVLGPLAVLVAARRLNLVRLLGF